MKLRASVVVACGLSCLAPQRSLARVTLLGVEAIPRAISSDGSTAVGDFNFQQTAFRWTLSGGRNDFGLDPGMPSQTSASAVSADGTYVGVGASPGGPLRWHGPGASILFGGGGRPTGISADGSKMVWWDGPITGPFYSFYWREGVGVQTIPVGNARATGLSRDGGVVCGGTGSRAFTWTPSGGARVLNSADGFSPSSATDINFDGTIVIGSSGPLAAATIWRNEVPTTLPFFADYGFEPTCLNDDASVVAGLGGSISGTDAIIWTPARGTELFTTYLASFGMSFPAGFRPSQITGVSGSGLVFCGYGDDGVIAQGFVVTVPSPSAACLLTFGALASIRRRRRESF